MLLSGAERSLACNEHPTTTACGTYALHNVAEKESMYVFSQSLPFTLSLGLSALYVHSVSASVILLLPSALGFHFRDGGAGWGVGGLTCGACGFV